MMRRRLSEMGRVMAVLRKSFQNLRLRADEREVLRCGRGFPLT